MNLNWFSKGPIVKKFESFEAFGDLDDLGVHPGEAANFYPDGQKLIGKSNGERDTREVTKASQVDIGAQSFDESLFFAFVDPLVFSSQRLRQDLLCRIHPDVDVPLF